MAIQFDKENNNIEMVNAYFLMKNVQDAQQFIHNFDNTIPFKYKGVQVPITILHFKKVLWSEKLSEKVNNV